MPGLAKSHTVSIMDLSAKRGREADTAAGGAACFRFPSYLGSNSSHHTAMASAGALPSFLSTQLSWRRPAVPTVAL